MVCAITACARGVVSASRRAASAARRSRSTSPRRLGDAEPVVEPSFAFGPQTRDRVRQWTAGLAYEGRRPRVGELEVGLQATDYEKVSSFPDGQRPTTRARPWLVNVALAVHATDALAAYAGFTRGLEESGIARATQRTATRRCPHGVRGRVQRQRSLRASSTPAPNM
jgi:hypothetical protein